MVDRAAKFFRKLNAKQYERVYRTADKIKKNKLQGLDIKPLTGRRHWYRCRVGKVRIIFIKTGSGRNVIHTIDFRGGAYKK